MSLLTLELKNEADLELLLSFAKRLNISILNISKTKRKRHKSPILFLEKIAERGGLLSVSNPSEWQREIRKDNKLINRD